MSFLHLSRAEEEMCRERERECGETISDMMLNSQAEGICNEKTRSDSIAEEEKKQIYIDKINMTKANLDKTLLMIG